LDTIVAIATPPGEGAVGIVRLSGPKAVDLASSHVVLSRPLNKLENFRIGHGYLRLNGRETDEILVFVARGPRSYTGEDTVEFQCHGSPPLLNRLVRSLEAAGARAAEPGEFTKRAFLNGRMDLTQAEAVADLVSATTDYGLDAAFFQLRGGLRDRFVSLSNELKQTKTLLEAALDFSEDVSVKPERVGARLSTAIDLLIEQIASYETGKRVRQGARVTLCGLPNVGKSSLMNALLGQDRAIVTEIAGTTRDTIDESVEINGLKVVLTDTAGLRDTGDPVEKEGTRRSNLAVSAADLVLHVCDGSVRPPTEDISFIEKTADAILVLNKSDLGVSEAWTSLAEDRKSVFVSALTGDGLDDLRSHIKQVLMADPEIGLEGITNERHVNALERTRLALEAASTRLREGAPGEIISFEIDEGLSALAGIIGETTAQDILDEIFSQFCIGK
jgi:tRNA modification GTPase